MGWFGDIIDGITGGGDSGDAAKEGSEIAASATERGARVSAGEILHGGRYSARGAGRGREYLQHEDRYPRAISTDAQRRLAGAYGLEGGIGNQQQFINQARKSPIYNAIMQTRGSGEDAILRNASATGGLRSGDASSNLYQYNQELEANALLSAYGDQLANMQYLSELPTHDLPIANAYATEGDLMGRAIRDAGLVRGQGIAQGGQLRGQGEVAAAQAQQAGRGGFLDLVGQLGGAWLGAGGGNPFSSGGGI